MVIILNKPPVIFNKILNFFIKPQNQESFN